MQIIIGLGLIISGIAIARYSSKEVIRRYKEHNPEAGAALEKEIARLNTWIKSHK